MATPTTQLTPEQKLYLHNLAQRRKQVARQIKKTNIAKPPVSHHRGLFDSVVHFAGKELSLTAKQVASSLIHTVPGVIELGKSTTEDLRDLVTHGDVTPERLGRIGLAMAQGIKTDIQHPLANPGNLLMDAFMFEQGGASLLRRVGRVQAKRGRLIRGEPEPELRKTEPPQHYPGLEGPVELKGTPKTKEAKELLSDMEKERQQRLADLAAGKDVVRPEGAPKQGKGFVAEAKQVLEQPHIKGELGEEGRRLEYPRDYRFNKELNLQGEGSVLEAGGPGKPQLRNGVRIALVRVSQARLGGKEGHLWRIRYYDESQARRWQNLSFKPTQAEIDRYVAAGGDPADLSRFTAPDIIGTDPKTAREIFEHTVNQYQGGYELRDLDILRTQYPVVKGSPTGGIARRLGMLEEVTPEERLMTPTERRAHTEARLRSVAEPMAQALPEAVSLRRLDTPELRAAAIKELVPLVNKGHVRDAAAAAKALGTTEQAAKVLLSRARRAVTSAKKQGIANRVAYTRVSEEALARLRVEKPTTGVEVPELSELFRVTQEHPLGQRFRGKEEPAPAPVPKTAAEVKAERRDKQIRDVADQLHKVTLRRMKAEEKKFKPDTIRKHREEESRLRKRLNSMQQAREKISPRKAAEGEPHMPVTLIERERQRRAAQRERDAYKAKADVDAAAEAAAKATEPKTAAPAAAKEAAAEAGKVEVRTELPTKKAAPETIPAEAKAPPKQAEPVTLRATLSDGTVYERTVERTPPNWKAWLAKEAVPHGVDLMSAKWEKVKPELGATAQKIEEPAVPVAAEVKTVGPDEVLSPAGEIVKVEQETSKVDTPLTPEEAAQHAEIDQEWERRRREVPATSAASAAAAKQRDLRMAQERLAKSEAKLDEVRQSGTDSEFREAEADRDAAAARVLSVADEIAKAPPREIPAGIPRKSPAEKPPATKEAVRKEMGAVARAAADLSYAKRQAKATGFKRLDEVAKAQQALERARTDATIVKEAQVRNLSPEQVAAQKSAEVADAINKEFNAKKRKTEGARAEGTSDRQLGITKNILTERFGVSLDKWQDIRAEMRTAFNKGDVNLESIFQRHLGDAEGSRVFSEWKNDFEQKFRVSGGAVDEVPDNVVRMDDYRKGKKVPPRTPIEATFLALSEFFKSPPRETMNIAPPPPPKAPGRGKKALPDVVPERTRTPLEKTVHVGKEEEFVQSLIPLYEQTLSTHPTVQYLQRRGFERARRVAGEFRTPGEAVGPGTRWAQRVGLEARAQRYLEKKRYSTYTRLSTLNDANEIALRAAAIENNQARGKYLQQVIDDRQKYLGSTTGWQRGMDTLNQLSTMGVLYMKGPAFYVPNFVGQGLIFAMSSKFNVPKMVRAMKLVREIQQRSELATEVMLSSVGHGTLAKLVRPHAGAKGKIPEYLARKPYEFLAEVYAGGIEVKGKRITPGVDRQWRAASIGVELLERGVTSADEAIDLMTNAERRGDWLDAVQRADDNAVSFSHMGDAERDAIRRIVFFYPWLKGASRFSVRYLANHPVGAAVMVGASRYAADVQEQTLPNLPSYLEGVFRGPDINLPFIGNLSKENVPGIGTVPRFINPQSLTVLGTPGEILSAAEANVLSGKVAGSQQLAQYLNPTLSTALAVSTRREPFTGAEFPAGMSVPDILKQELGQLAYPVALKDAILKARGIKEGTEDPSETLLPRGLSDVAGRFFTGLGPTPLNPKESEARYFAEQTALSSKQQRVYMKSTRDRQTYHETAVKLGMIKPSEKLPANLRQAFNQRAQREANQKAWEAKLGHPLSSLERLEADINLAVRKKVLSAGAASSLLNRVTTLASDSQVERVYRRFREVVWGPDVIGAYKKYFNDQLERRGEARLTVP